MSNNISQLPTSTSIQLTGSLLTPLSIPYSNNNYLIYNSTASVFTGGSISVGSSIACTSPLENIDFSIDITFCQDGESYYQWHDGTLFDFSDEELTSLSSPNELLDFFLTRHCGWSDPFLVGNVNDDTKLTFMFRITSEDGSTRTETKVITYGEV